MLSPGLYAVCWAICIGGASGPIASRNAGLAAAILVAVLVIMPVLNQPHSTLVVFLSLLPFTSPVIMVVRVAVAHVPLAQILLSLGLLAGGFVFTILPSGRIYRIGIPMYGKKANLKDVVRWLRTS